MGTVRDVVGARGRLEPEVAPGVAQGGLEGPSPGQGLEREGPSGYGLHALEARRRARVAAAVRSLRLPVAVYAVSRALLLLDAVVDGALQHTSLLNELGNWDGFWYLSIAWHGYPHQVLLHQSTLGFFPLYPMVMWLVAHVLGLRYEPAGLVVSGIGGLVATILVQRLAAGWWGDAAGRRAAVIFSLFPGSVVFSMVYSEGLLLPLVAGCLLALQKRRFVLAGALAGLSTAIGPDALVVIPVCLVAAFLERRRRGSGDRRWRRSLAAPALSLTGVGGFAVFLWAWTGSPFATLTAQRSGWGERTSAFALVRTARQLAAEISFSHFDYHQVNLNFVVALLGAVFLVLTGWMLAKERRLVSPEALTWTLGVSFLALTSQNTPPNPRLLITAFPLVVVLARRMEGAAFNAVVAASTVALVGLSALTYVGIALRP